LYFDLLACLPAISEICDCLGNFEDILCFQINIRNTAKQTFRMELKLGIFLFSIVSISSGFGGSMSAYQAAFASGSGSGNDDLASSENEVLEAEVTDTGIPLLPASDSNEEIPSIKLGETIRFEEMGPIIINLDGTTRRIENWNEMSDHEKKVSWRRIAKRNEERRKMLLEKLQQDEKSE
jgi:hypothetical protein